MVRSRFLKLDSSHIEFVMECLHNNTTEVRNMKQYLLTVLFNAPTTMNNHYTATRSTTICTQAAGNGRLFCCTAQGGTI